MKRMIVLTMLAALCWIPGKRCDGIGAAIANDSVLQEIKLHKGMTLPQVQVLYPDMHHDVWLCFMSAKAGVKTLIVGTYGYGRRPRMVDLFYLAESFQIEVMEQGHIAGVRMGMSQAAIRHLLGDPSKTGSAGVGDNKLEFWYYNNWVLHFKGGTLIKESNRPVINVSAERSANFLIDIEQDGAVNFVYLVNNVASKAQLGEVWRTHNMIFQFWQGKLSRWGSPKDNLLNELNNLKLMYGSSYMPDPIPVTLIASIPPSTIEQRDAIRRGRFQNGMSKQMVRASIGLPRDINRTVLEGRVVQEQWVYGGIDGTYLYFNEDDKLDSWQN